jgi:hypothetical protein
MAKITQSYTLEDPSSERIKIVCKECNSLTLHAIVACYRESGNEDCGRGNCVDWTKDHEIIQCQGCETVSFRIASSDSESWSVGVDGLSEQYFGYTYYPTRFEGNKNIDVYMLPEKVREIYQETVLAVENEQNILAGIGIRALIETICKDQNSTGKNLPEKIDFLHKKSIITEEGVNILHKLRVLGNDAAHEVKAHKKETLILALEVLVHMLDGTYILPQKIKKIFPEKKPDKDEF